MPPVLQAPLIARGLLVLILAAGVYFFSGFLVPVLAALIIGFASWPLYRRGVRLCGGNTVLAASLALVVVIVVLVVPLSLALHYALQEASTFIAWLLQANRVGAPVPGWISSLPMVGERLADYWQEYLGEPHALGEWVQLLSGEHLGNIYRTALAATGNLVNLGLTVLFMLITLFFVYKDGERIAGQLDIVGERILPQRWNRFSRVVPATVSATVTGMGLIALGEGVVLGIAYWIAGVPSPVLLGVVTAFMALIPGGAPLAFTLVSIYLVGADKLAAGLGLFVWGTVELFIVDKTLRPRLVGGPVKLPFLPTFFGLVGGVKTMGIVGLFVGPVLMALLVAIWREWLHSVELEAGPATVEAEAAPVEQQAPPPAQQSAPRRAPAQTAPAGDDAARRHDEAECR
ncbi:AI-2E family transporter [Azoarcus indigens]|uniref:Putative PurR-regulated permease PerM n=1 Tax=Azoarcus indigens TaxID=29545 RepID=A0A4R6DSY8_9RHOO|nr:AI-2E family transporter [Azoarcus indigens]NMG67015.1 AI-2E family transporter [Azoarcus indigens]TDN48197.1 putative PurR-regulated permease PerM [Azoarcus indigens]